MKCQTIMGILEQLAPKKIAESWDNPGLLAGNPQQEISKILICLDVSLPVVEKAIKEKVDMIIAHHPMIIFKGVFNLRTDNYDGEMFQKILANNIAVYAAHTNLDIAAGGCNDVLAKLLGLEKIEGFVPTSPTEAEFLGRIGYLSEAMTIEAFSQKVCQSLPAEHVRMVRAGDKLVEKVAVCSGSGAEFIGKAAFKGADVYVTADVKYHEAQKAVKLGVHLVDAGHFATEFPMVRTLAEYLRQELAKQDIEILEDDVSKDFFQVVR